MRARIRVTKPIAQADAVRLLNSATGAGEIEAKYAQNLIRQLQAKGLVK